MPPDLGGIAAALRALPVAQRYGRVVSVRGALVEVGGLGMAARIGARLRLAGPTGPIDAEITGLDQGVAQCLTFADPQGIAGGSRAFLAA
ncbi:MAG: flagellum-specific synthase, partial [Pseudomonadota bacterium]